MPELIHTFALPVPIERAWAALDDPGRVAAAFPGALVRDRGSGSLSGELAVKIGPVTTRYEGTATVTWRDRVARRFVVAVDAAEVGGVGRLEATVHVTLSAAPAAPDAPDATGATSVEVRANVKVAGRVAQFGDGVLSDVLARMLADLATALEAAGFPEAPTLELDPLPESEHQPEGDPTFDLVVEQEPPRPDGDVTFDALPPPPPPPPRPFQAPPPPPPPPLSPPPSPPPPAAEPESEPEPEPEPDPEPEPVLSWPQPEPAPLLRWPQPDPTNVSPDADPDDGDDVDPDLVAPTRPAPVLRPDPLPRPKPVVRLAPKRRPPPALPPPPPVRPANPPAPANPPTPASVATPASLATWAPPIRPEPEPEPAPEPAPVIPPPPQPEPKPEPEPEPEPAPRAHAPIDVLPPASGDASLAAKAAPYAVVLVLLWLLRRIFGSDDR